LACRGRGGKGKTAGHVTKGYCPSVHALVGGRNLPGGKTKKTALAPQSRSKRGIRKKKESASGNLTKKAGTARGVGNPCRGRTGSQKNASKTWLGVGKCDVAHTEIKGKGTKGKWNPGRERLG